MERLSLLGTIFLVSGFLGSALFIEGLIGSLIGLIFLMVGVFIVVIKLTR